MDFTLSSDATLRLAKVEVKDLLLRPKNENLGFDQRPRCLEAPADDGEPADSCPDRHADVPTDSMSPATETALLLLCPESPSASPRHLTAIASISTSDPLGKAPTWTVDRAGGFDAKNSA